MWAPISTAIYSHQVRSNVKTTTEWKQQHFCVSLRCFLLCVDYTWNMHVVMVPLVYEYVVFSFVPCFLPWYLAPGKKNMLILTLSTYQVWYRGGRRARLSYCSKISYFFTWSLCGDCSPKRGGRDYRTVPKFQIFLLGLCVGTAPQRIQVNLIREYHFVLSCMPCFLPGTRYETYCTSYIVPNKNNDIDYSFSYVNIHTYMICDTWQTQVLPLYPVDNMVVSLVHDACFRSSL